jgi:DNA modification methylase
VEIVSVPITSLSPHPRNYRAHPDQQLEHLQASLQEFGWARNVVISSDNVILAGHGIVEAARRRGETEVPVHRLALPSTDPKAEKFLVLENEVSRLAQDDDAQLAALLADIQRTDGLEGTGYDDAALDALIGELAKQDRENAPLEDPGPEEPPVEPVTKLGDVWLMGEHRLVCGDCTDGAVISACLAGATPKLCVTDPPYGVEYDPNWRKQVKGECATPTSTGTVSNDEMADWSAAIDLCDADVAYVWHGGLHSAEVAAGLMRVGYQLVSQIVWVKSIFALSRGNYHWQHEPCWYAVRNNADRDWIGGRDQTTTWQIPALHGYSSTEEHTGHGTQKPVECMARPLRNHAGDVIDPFLGSGTTLIAAEQLGRVCYGIEIEPRYVDVSVRRWCKATGRTATLESTGEPFPMPAPEGA